MLEGNDEVGPPGMRRTGRHGSGEVCREGRVRCGIGVVELPVLTCV